MKVPVVEITLDQVPEYLRGGDYYKALLSEQDDEVLFVPADVLKADNKVDNANDLRHLLSSLRFWIVDIAFVVEYLLSTSMDDEICLAIESFEATFPIMRIVRLAVKATPIYQTCYRAPCPLLWYVKAKHVCSAKILFYFAQHALAKADNVADVEHFIASYSAESVAANGDLEMLKCLFENNISTTSLCYHSARTGQLHCLEYLVSKGSHLFVKTSSIASTNGHVHILEFLHEKNKPFDPYCGRIAAEKGHVECLRFLHKIRRAGGIFIPAVAARNGHLHCLQFAYENGFPWDASTCCDAATGGHLDCLKYAHKNGCPWDNRTTLNASKHFPCLVYAIQNNCPYRDTSAQDAFIAGHDISGFYILKHCPGQYNAICIYAAKIGRLDILQACHEANIPWHAHTCTAAHAAGQQECLAYALEHGAPAPVESVPQLDDDAQRLDALTIEMEQFFI